MDFLDNIECVIFGDDISLSVSNRFKHLINYDTISNPIDELGAKHTLAIDSDIVEGFQPLHEVSFLKRFFHQDRGVWLSRLEKASIEKTFSYSQVQHVDIDIWIQTVTDHLIEAMLWGEEYYDNFRNSLYHAMVANRCSNDFQKSLAPTLSTSYQAVREKYFVTNFQ